MCSSKWGMYRFTLAWPVLIRCALFMKVPMSTPLNGGP
jgi:hypothetical protein